MEDNSLKILIELFDVALESDNPAVKKALRNFMMVAAIVHAQELDDNEREVGPFETLIKKVSDLERMYWDLKNTTINTNGNYWKDPPRIQNPTWVYNPTTSVSPTSITSSSTLYGKPTSTASVSEITEYLKDLKIT